MTNKTTPAPPPKPKPRSDVPNEAGSKSGTKVPDKITPAPSGPAVPGRKP